MNFSLKHTTYLAGGRFLYRRPSFPPNCKTGKGNHDDDDDDDPDDYGDYYYNYDDDDNTIKSICIRYFVRICLPVRRKCANNND